MDAVGEGGEVKFEGRGYGKTEMERNKSAVMQGLARSMCAGSGAHRGQTSGLRDRQYSLRCRGPNMLHYIYCLNMGQVLVKQGIFSFIQQIIIMCYSS